MTAVPQVKSKLKYSIAVIAGPHSGQSFDFDKEVVSLGRGPENDIVLANDPKVSRHHAEFHIKSNQLVLINVSQKNFVILEGQKISTEYLPDTCQIEIGETLLKIQVHREVPSAPVPSAEAVPTIKPAVPFGANPVLQKSATPAMPRAQMPATGPGMGIPPQPMAAPRPASGGYGNMGATTPPRPIPGTQKSKAPFYIVVALVAVVGYWLLSDSGNKAKEDPNAVRSANQIELEMKLSEESTKQYREQIEKAEGAGNTYRRTQEYFVKGFRDYQQGQYARARESFQVVLNLDPSNELAKRYLHLSRVKFDELVKSHMIQGNRYREKKNWRMCQSNFSTVMIMLNNNQQDPIFKEAKRYFEECQFALKGRL